MINMARRFLTTRDNREHNLTTNALSTRLDEHDYDKLVITS